MPPRPSVLLLTHRSDYFTVDRVAERLAEAGARPVRFDTDDVPAGIALSLEDPSEDAERAADRGAEPRLRARWSTPRSASPELAERIGEISDEQVEAVWTRSPWPPELPADLDPAYREHAVRQCRALLDGWLEGLAGEERWINPPAANARAGNKLVQHRAARAAGLTLPPTLITNDDAAARRFVARHRGEVVAKLLLPLSRSMDGSGLFLPTTVLDESDLEHLDELRYGPMIFQRRVAKRHELRVMAVDGELFAGALVADAAGGDDWRLSAPAATAWSRGELEPEASAGLRRLMRGLGLVAGVADFIVTPEGETVFLEINPLGEWGMLERDLGLPISRAIADALLRRIELAPS